MTKAELVEKVALETGLSKKSAAEATDAVFKAITEGVKKAGKVTIVGFGTFEKRRRGRREGRNPQTGETVIIEAKNVVAFKAGSKLKDAVN